jgi:hypothetical protein
VKRTLFFAPAAVLALRTFDRQIVRQIWAAIEALRDNPDTLTITSDTLDPSVFALTVSGDVTIWFEILDEQHAIRVLSIEE